jgi:hypothetical protein
MIVLINYAKLTFREIRRRDGSVFDKMSQALDNLGENKSGWVFICDEHDRLDMDVEVLCDPDASLGVVCLPGGRCESYRDVPIIIEDEWERLILLQHAVEMAGQSAGRA